MAMDLEVCEDFVDFSDSPAASAPDPFCGLTVADVVGAGNTGCTLQLHYTLGDFAEALTATNRTAAVVVDDDSSLVGLLTENDLLRAYFEGASPDHRLHEWLDSGAARASAPLLFKLTVTPSAPLAQVAELMVKNALVGDCACHHVVVREEDGTYHSVLSSRDLVKALCRQELLDRPPIAGVMEGTGDSGSDGDAHPAFREAAETVKHKSIQEVMKPRENVFTCRPSSSMQDVLKVLLMTQQNSTMVVDEHGAYGVVTPRDAVRAFADGVPASISISEWLRTSSISAGSRVITASATLADAAALMTARNVSHLLVLSPGSNVAAGTLSSLDIVLCTRARQPLLRPVAMQAGPTVGELMKQPWHLVAMCQEGATVDDAFRQLVATGKTSVVVPLPASPSGTRSRFTGGSGGFGPWGAEGEKALFTESDALRAFLDELPPETTVKHWLTAQEYRHPTMPLHFVVSPSVRLSDAASMMLSAGRAGQPCHHLVVQDDKGNWLGIFSALDLARALCGHCSELDLAKTGAWSTLVSMVMKPVGKVPTCRPSATLRDAARLMKDFAQDAVLVADASDGGFHGIFTARGLLEAIAEDASNDRCTVGEWLQKHPGIGQRREVAIDTRLLDAAGVMTAESFHHLVVLAPPPPNFAADNDDMQEGSPTGDNVTAAAATSAGPAGVLSSLDVVRGIASMHTQCPFVSLGWLWWCRGPSSCTLKTL
eukprot:TRINITY_DN13011_c0_g1_i1.p1 TRINITY_DN13011_c0_g1~~TRINITY_DN13011_c0_g1_i1.p1  ORF type:complete len:749 (-),score=160.98 TRINITY_DN13011_c0_g1_i1:192-2330(-)